MQGYTITVVVPLFNKREYIDRALLSVFSQSYRPSEVIVVDDGSTDDGVDIVQNKWGEHVHVVQQHNSGPGAARNAGIRASSGQYVAFLDADDEWHSNYLRRIVDCIEHYHGTEIGAFTSFYDRRHESYEPPVRTGTPFSIIKSFCVPSMYGYVVNSSTAVVPRSVFDKVGVFNETQNMLEDIDMWIRISLNYPIARVNEVLTTIHYDDPSGITRQLSARPWPIQVDSICEHFGCKVDDIPGKHEREYCQDALYRYCLGMIRWGMFEEFSRSKKLSHFNMRQRWVLRLARKLQFLIPKRSQELRNEAA